MNEHLLSQSISMDMEWLINTPPLLAPHPLVWQPNALNSLNIQEINLTPIEIKRCQTRKLGHYFETIAGLLFERHPRYEILAKNRPIHRNQVTVGEIDLLLKDLHSDQILHLELAVKFYLQVPGFNPAHIAWIGAGQRDFFHQKVNRLFSHQLRLSDIAYDSRCWPSDLPLPDHKALWMPGRLYLPHTAGSVSFDQQTMSGTPWQINPEVQQSVWFETGQLEESSLKPLAKTGWLRGMTFIEQNRQLPAQFCHPDHPAPVYVLPLNWQTDAQNALNDYKATL